VAFGEGGARRVHLPDLEQRDLRADRFFRHPPLYGKIDLHRLSGMLVVREHETGDAEGRVLVCLPEPEIAVDHDFIRPPHFVQIAPAANEMVFRECRAVQVLESDELGYGHVFPCRERIRGRRDLFSLYVERRSRRGDACNEQDEGEQTYILHAFHMILPGHLYVTLYFYTLKYIPFLPG
jgi:hypothetical protein